MATCAGVRGLTILCYALLSWHSSAACPAQVSGIPIGSLMQSRSLDSIPVQRRLFKTAPGAMPKPLPLTVEPISGEEKTHAREYYQLCISD